MRRTGLKLNNTLSVILTLAIFILAACGGGGGSTAGGGIGGTGVIASGTVTQKGSIFVNGVEYDTSEAQVSINSVLQSDDSALRRGMVVEVEGEYIIDRTTGTAATVGYEDIVKGPVKNLTPSGSFVTMDVLGQTIIFEQGNTLVDNGIGGVTTDLSTIADGDVIEVSGLRDNLTTNGTIRASYVKEENSPAPTTTYQVLGFIENDTLAQFEIAGLTVISGSGHNRNGSYVKIEGLRSNYTDPTLSVATVTVKSPGLSVADKDDAEIEGIISSYVGDITAGALTVNGQPVTYNATTVFEGGTAADLADGLKIEAEGTLASGIVAADKIQFRDNVKIRANVDTTGSSVTLEGLPGIVIVADGNTEFDGITNMNALLQYDHIEVRGREVADSDNLTRTVYAKRVKIRKDAPVDPADRETQVELQGLVDSFNAGSTQLVILDITMDTSTITDPTNFTLNDGTIIGETAFYNYLTANPDNTVVDMNGTLNTTNSQVTWDQAEIEND